MTTDSPIDFLSQLQGKIYARALVARAEPMYRELEQFLWQIKSQQKVLPPLKTLEEAVDSAAGVVTMNIVSSAMQNQSLLLPIAQKEAKPGADIVVCAFLLLCGVHVAAFVESEGFKFDVDKTAVSWLRYCLVSHSDAERIAIYNQGLALMRQLLGAEQKNVRDNIEMLRELVRIYIMSEGIPLSESYTSEKLEELFGSMLRSLLAMLE